MTATGFDESKFFDYIDVLMGGASGDSFIEMRSRVRETGMAAAFFPRSDADRLAYAVAERSVVTDVYIGCAPRAMQRGDKQAIREVWALWVECDGAESAAAARRVMPAPALIIGSGSGENVHAYWPLREPSRRTKRRSRISGSRPRFGRTSPVSTRAGSSALRGPGTTSTLRLDRCGL